MAGQLCEVVLVAPQISMKNVLVTATGTQESVVPGDAANSTLVSLQDLDDLLFCCVPDLEVASVGSDGE